MSEDRARGGLASAVGAALLVSYTLAALAGIAGGALTHQIEIGIAVTVLVGLGGAVSLGSLAILRPAARRPLVVLAEVLLFVVLPAWGLAINQSLPVCDPCGDANRALAWPGVLLVYAAYLGGLAAYSAARWHPEPLRTAPEAILLTLLALGVLTTTALSLQFNGNVVLGLIYAPVGLPLAAPPIVSVVWGAIGLRRGSISVRAAAIAGGAASTITLLDAALHLALTSKVGLYAGAFAATCGWGMSTMTPPEVDCHYLCTVAAQGHPWLVRPLRTGVRRGRPIVVNRQLAVANAFEDLIHERWPRPGRWLRRTYDRFGLPISRYLLHPLAADAVFVAMLPAQLGFELFLRAFDRDPEARIDRMYR